MADINRETAQEVADHIGSAGGSAEAVQVSGARQLRLRSRSYVVMTNIDIRFSL